MRECSKLPSSRLSKLPIELLAQIEVFVQQTSRALRQRWATYQACFTRKCGHHLEELPALILRHKTFEAHREVIKELNAKVFADRRARNPIAYRWGQQLKYISLVFGVKPMISGRSRSNAPQNTLEAFVTIPVGCRKFGRDCTDAYEWIFDGTIGSVLSEASSDTASEIERKMAPEKLMNFKRAMGQRHLALSDEDYEQWDKCEEWKEPVLRLFRPLNRPRGTGLPKTQRLSAET